MTIAATRAGIDCRSEVGAQRVPGTPCGPRGCGCCAGRTRHAEAGGIGRAETGATTIACDATRGLDLVIDSAGGRARGAITEVAPEAIADSYFHLHCQLRSARVWAIELRPWVETF
jgi:hypothetical protein